MLFSVLSGCWRLSCRLSPDITKMNSKPSTHRSRCWEATSRKSRKCWTMQHLYHQRLKWSTASSRRSLASPMTTWWEVLLPCTAECSGTASDRLTYPFYFVGPQRVGGKTGKEWEEAEKAAEDLHEKGSGVRRYLLLFTSATSSNDHMTHNDLLPALQLLRRLPLRTAGPSMNWVARWPSRGRRRILKGCWSTARRKRPAFSNLLSWVSPQHHRSPY